MTMEITQDCEAPSLLAPAGMKLRALSENHMGALAQYGRSARNPAADCEHMAA